MRDLEPAGRAPPASFETEQSVIGGLLLDNDAIDRIGDLKAEHFFSHEHRAIFAVVVDMIGAGKPADVLTVYEALRARIDRPDLLPYLDSLAQNVPSATNIRRYAEIVRDRAIKRAIVTISDEIADMAIDGKEDAKTVLDVAGAKLERLAAARVGSDPVRAGDDMPAHLEVVDQRSQGVTQAIPTGFGDIDRKLNGGMRRGQVIVVAGRTSMGKTAFALQIARQVAVDHSALFLSMEMPRAELHDRNLAALGRVDLSKLLSAEGLDADEWRRVVRAAAVIDKELNLYLDQQGALRLLDVRMKARMVKRRHGLDLLVIDYLTLMEGPGDNRYVQIDGITRGLKALAKELDVVILLLSQLNRKLEDRENKRPQPSDLRDSGSIEQDADIILLLYRDDVYRPDTPQPGICEINIAKNRQGSTGREALMYIGPQVRFESHAGPWQPPLGIAPKRAKQFEPD